jgi:hypothetical protein
MMNEPIKPFAYKINAINMVTTSEAERDKWINAGHQVESLYPASVVEALNGKYHELKSRSEIDARTIEALKQENEKQAKRIAELEYALGMRILHSEPSTKED